MKVRDLHWEIKEKHPEKKKGEKQVREKTKDGWESQSSR